MPIVKSIHIYTEQGLLNCTDYVEDKTKTSVNNNNKTEASYLSNAIGYAANESKTSIKNNDFLIQNLLDGDMDVLVSGFRCNVMTVEDDFERIRTDYYSKKKENLSNNQRARIAYHFIQSFDPRFEIDPRLVHQIGLELLEKLEHYQGTINTHMNTEHIHNHIIMNAFSCDGPYKWKDNMENLHMVRTISDELSLKYGIPIILNPAKGKGMSYTEWMHVQKGNSWKQQIRNDIAATMQVCSSWSEFTQIMRAAGYEIRETAKSVSYGLPYDKNKRVRDVKLGPEYTKAALLNFWQNNIEQDTKSRVINPATQVEIKKNKKINIYVSRYTSAGRKRSDLEIVFLIAIKIIKVLGDRFRNEEVAKLHPTNPINRLASWKISQMMDSLHLLQSLNINSREELKELLNKTGAELSHMKKQVAELESQIGNSDFILSAIQDVKELSPFITSTGIGIEDLAIPEMSEKDIRINRATIAPLTAKQRRDLFIALSNNDSYRLNCNFDELTHNEGKAVLNFLSGKTIERPNVVVSIDEYNNFLKEKKFEKIRKNKESNLKKKYGNLPITDAQRNIISRLMDSKTYNLDLDTLSYYDGLMLISYLKAENPFSDKLITEEMAMKLQQVLSDNNFIINRALHTVTDKEYYEMLNYFSKKSNALPDLLKPAPQITGSVVSQIKELLDYRNISIPFDVEELSSVDANKLYSYLLYIDVIPECLSDSNNLTPEHYEVILKSNLLDYPDEYYDSICKFREAIITLSKIGVELDSINQAENEINELKSELVRFKSLKDSLGKDYYNYSRLNYNLGLAENNAFTYGSLYNKMAQDVDVTELKILSEIHNDILDEEREIDEKTSSNVYQKEDEYFNSMEKLI